MYSSGPMEVPLYTDGPSRLLAVSKRISPWLRDLVVEKKNALSVITFVFFQFFVNSSRPTAAGFVILFNRLVLKCKITFCRNKVFVKAALLPQVFLFCELARFWGVKSFCYKIMFC